MQRASVLSPATSIPACFRFTLSVAWHTPEQMRDAIHKEIDKLKATDVTDAELAMYKTRARADLLRGLADNQGWRMRWRSTRRAMAIGASCSCNWIRWTR